MNGTFLGLRQAIHVLCLGCHGTLLQCHNRQCTEMDDVDKADGVDDVEINLTGFNLKNTMSIV